MSDPASKRTCPECGLDYSPRGRGHGCPHCLLRLAMPGQPAGAAEGEPLRAPSGLKSRFFGDYEILEEIARGGMGVVYKARQLSLNRLVALKMILAGNLLSTEARLRFRVEIEAVAQLNHPNIVSLYESSEHEGIHYFTMRLVEGGNLGDRLGRGHSMRENVALLVKVCRTVHYAHQRGILHRDLKPSNILIDLQGEPHVADFGLAKSLDHDTGFTYSSSILGSPNYMAPEQASSHHGPLSTAVDVYGLGAILYQILTGHPPFQGKTPLETVRQVVDSAPVPPRKLNPQVDADLATICLKCLEKKPADRYDSAEQLAQDLDQWLRGLPIQARPVGTLGTLWRWSRRHPAVAALSLALLLALAGLAAGATVAAMRIRHAQREAVAHLRVSLLEQARTLRFSDQMGMRSEGLRLVRQAAALGGPPEFKDRVRDELLATLALTDMEFSPQGPAAGADPLLSLLDPRLERLATVTEGTNLVVRRLSDNAEVFRQSVGALPVVRVEAFSPNGRYLALRDTGGISFWDLESGRLCFATNGPGRVFCFAAHAPEVFLEEWECGLSVRALPSFKEVRRLQAEPDPPGVRPNGWRLISLSADGKLLLGARAHGNTIEMLDARSGQAHWRAATDNPVTAIAWQPVLRRVITAASDGLLQFWRWEDGLVTRLLRLPRPVFSLALDHSNYLMATACDDRTVRLWHLISYRQLFQSQCDARSLWFDEEGERLATIQRGGQVGWLDLSRSSEYHEIIITRTSTDVERCEFHPGGQLVAGGFPGRIDLRRVADGRSLAHLPVEGLPLFAFDPLGEGVVTSHSKGVVHRALRQGPGVIELHPPRFVVQGPRWRSLAFSADGQRFFAANASSNAVFVFDRSLSNCLHTIGPHPGVDAIAASANGRLVATGSSRSRDIRVWEAAGSPAPLVELPAGRQSQFQFSSDGRWFLVHGDSFDLRATKDWTPAPPLPFPGDRPMLGAACFSHDGRLLAVVVDQLELQLFDLANWKAIGRLRGTLEQRINAVAFSRDGARLAAASARGRLCVWDLRRIRQQLAESHLDWDLPPLPAAAASNRLEPDLVEVP